MLGRVRGNESSPAQHLPPGIALCDSAEAAGTRSIHTDPGDSPTRLIRECISRKQLGYMAQREQIPVPQPFGPQGSPESFPLPHLSLGSSGTPGASQSWVKHREGVTTVAAGP